jgi:hypothetical protein
MKIRQLVLMIGCAATLQAQDPAPYVSNPAPAPNAVSVSTNLLKNGSFEFGMIELGKAPDDWGFIVKSGTKVNAGITETAAHTGKRSVGIGTPATINDKWQVLAFNAPVQANVAYQFSCWVKSYPQDPLAGGASGYITIEWKDASGAEITRIQGDTWDAAKLASGEWLQVKVQGEAPPGSASATFAVTYLLNKNQKSGGSFLVDDALAEKITK